MIFWVVVSGLKALSHVKCGRNLRSIISHKYIVITYFLRSHASMNMLQDNLTVVQVMAWCQQTTFLCPGTHAMIFAVRKHK